MRLRRAGDAHRLRCLEIGLLSYECEIPIAVILPKIPRAITGVAIRYLYCYGAVEIVVPSHIRVDSSNIQTVAPGGKPDGLPLQLVLIQARFCWEISTVKVMV